MNETGEKPVVNEFREKLLSLGFVSRQGTTKKTGVIDEADGTLAGYQVEHWNGRVDAVAKPKPLAVKVEVAQ